LQIRFTTTVRYKPSWLSLHCGACLFCTVQWLSGTLYITGGGQCSKLLFTEKCKKSNSDVNRSTTFSFTISEIIYWSCFWVCILIYIYQHIQNDYTYMQCRSSPTLASQNAYRVPLMVIYIKRFWLYAASRSQMAFKTKYPNCRHDFGRPRPVARS